MYTELKILYYSFLEGVQFLFGILHVALSATGIFAWDLPDC